MNTIDSKLKSHRIKNVLYQLFSTILSFLIIPLYSHSMSSTDFGVWLTMLSVCGWLNVLNVGVANGVRKKLITLAVRKKSNAFKIYVSSNYSYLGIYLMMVFIIGVLMLFYVDVSKLFNAHDIFYLRLSVILVFASSLINLFFTINIAVASALFNFSYANFSTFILNLFVFVAVYIFTIFKHLSVYQCSILYFFSSIIANLLLLYVLYKGRNSLFSLKYISFRAFKENLGESFNFFIIQISGVIIFTTDNFLVLQLCGPDYVPEYAVTMKFFSAFLIVLWLYTGPLWPAYSAKVAEGDLQWVSLNFKKSIIVCFGLIVIGFCFLLIYKFILLLWLGNVNYYNPILAVCIFIIIALRIWNGIFSTLLNSINALKTQVITDIVGAILNIPLAIIFVKIFNFGVIGVAVATIISLFIFACSGPLVVYKLIRNWNNVG